jgi:hypothetical protein
MTMPSPWSTPSILETMLRWEVCPRDRLGTGVNRSLPMAHSCRKSNFVQQNTPSGSETLPHAENIAWTAPLPLFVVPIGNLAAEMTRQENYIDWVPTYLIRKQVSARCWRSP